MTKVMIIPGNGITDISENWFPFVRKKLEKMGFTVIAKNMPDPDIARRKIWIPFIEKQLGRDQKAILIGHSSGAVAILRHLENHRAEGAVLVGVCYTDLGLKKEKLSGYYTDRWHWSKITKNVSWIVQFASTDDPYIPIKEARYIRDRTNSEYFEYNDQGHFGADVKKKEFPEIVELIKKKARKNL
jgi:predicted alpha/beta hydrolase family esterase